jgi:hypothetical protein
MTFASSSRTPPVRHRPGPSTMDIDVEDALSAPANQLEESKTTRRVLLEHIDAEIELHRKAIRTLEVQRNALVAVNQLPDELLVRIFAAIPFLPVKRTVRQLHNALSRDGSMPPPWVSAGQVCRRWREAGLSAALARRIDMAHSAAWTDALTQRARGAGLTARMTRANVITLNRFMHFVGRHRHDLEQMEVACGSPQEAMLISLFAAGGGESGEAPAGYVMERLTHLELRGSRGAFYTLPHRIDQGRLPNLRDLVLYNIVLGKRFSKTVLMRLSSLDLTYDVAHVGTISLKDMFKRLAHASGLNRLTLKVAPGAPGGGTELDEDLETIEPLVFDHLRTLEIDVPVSHLTRILDIIKAPNIRTVELMSDAWTGSADIAVSQVEQMALATRISRLLETFTARGLALEVFSYSNTSQVCRLDWTTATNSGEDARLSLVTECPRSPVKLPFISKLVPDAHWARLTSLRITSAYASSTIVTGEEWKTILGLLISLEDLSLGYEAGLRFLKMMDTSDVSYFPRLRRLALLGMGYDAIAYTLIPWLEERVRGAGSVPNDVIICCYDSAADGETGEAEAREVLGAMMREYAPGVGRVLWEWKIV